MQGQGREKNAMSGMVLLLVLPVCTAVHSCASSCSLKFSKCTFVVPCTLYSCHVDCMLQCSDRSDPPLTGEIGFAPLDCSTLQEPELQNNCRHRPSIC